MGTGTRRTTILLYGTRVLYGLSNHGPGRHRRPSRHRSRAPPVTVAAAAAAASGGAHAPHVVQVWNSNNPARMRGGGGRGSSVWSKVGLCAVRFCPHTVFMSFAGVVIIIVIIDRHTLLSEDQIFRRYFQSDALPPESTRKSKYPKHL